MVKNSLEIESRTESKKKEQPIRPAYFLSISLQNIRCFGPRQTLDLSDGKGRPAQWTIILGNNGVGKTTILQSLIALLPGISIFEYELGTHCLPKCFLGSGSSSWPHKWMPFRYADNGSYLAATFFSGIKLSESGNWKEVEDYYVQGFGGTGWNEGSLVLWDDVKGLACFGYGASRRMGETSLSEKDEDDPYASLFSDDVALLNAEEWLLQADYAAHAAKKDSSVQKQAIKRRDEIKDVLIKLLQVEDIKFTQLTKKQLKPGIEVKTPYGWVSIKELSLGYRTLVAWMVDLASRLFERYPNSPNPLAEPAVVLVDEIDLHLHPKLQRDLMGFLSELFVNTQFIATAHSPLVVQAATDANLVLLRREGDHVVIDNEVKAIHNWRVDQILTSDLFGLESARPPQLDDLLEERTKILSKGRLTKKDRKRLEEVEAQIGSLPTGETPEEMEAMDIIRRAAKRMKAEGI